MRNLLFLLLFLPSQAWAVYSATVTTTRFTISGVRHYVVTVTETEAAAASEWSVVGLPATGTITHYQATLTAGTGTTIQPTLGKATGWTADTQDEIADQSAAAAHVNDATKTRYTLTPGTSTIFGQSTVDAGADNSITTIFTIAEGHLP